MITNLDLKMHRLFRMYLACDTCGTGIGERCQRKSDLKRYTWLKNPHKGRLKSRVVCNQRQFGYTGYYGLPCQIAAGHSGKHISNMGVTWEVSCEQ